MLKINNYIDKFGLTGVIITALLSPCCFPLFAFLASALGLGSFELFGGWTMIVFQVMVLISVIGLYLSYRGHRRTVPLIIGIGSGLLIVYGYHFNFSIYWIYFLYIGMAGLLVATILNYIANKRNNCCDTDESPKLTSTIQCPECGAKKKEQMPLDSCVYFYECENCGTLLKPLDGDCCVFCSYGTEKCPPIQQGDKCC